MRVPRMMRTVGAGEEGEGKVWWRKDNIPKPRTPG